MKTMFLAGVFDTYPTPEGGGTGSVMREGLILLGALLVVIATLLVWAYLSRRKRRRAARREERRRRRHSLERDASKGVTETNQLGEERHGSRRRHHRPRNPTLAETGGLPPIRADVQRPPDPPH